MKKQILSFVLGGFTFLCIGAGVATTTDVLTVKPAMPKSIVHQEFDSYSDLNKIVASKTKDGYIVKSIVTNSSSYTSHYNGFIVMEKY